MRYKVLHITTHLGGGIGSVLMSWIYSDKQNFHRVLCLNNNYHKTYDPNVVIENMRFDRPKTAEYVAKADIVIVHFWNHPYMMDFLINTDIPECRLCVLAHSSGLFPPYVHPRKLIEYSDKFFFASKISSKAKNIIELPDSLKEKLGIIWTTGNIERFKDAEKKPHHGFNVCYVGTLDYSKMHPNFVELCYEIAKDLPDVNFIVIGEGADSEDIKSQVRDRNLEKRFLFTGVIDDVKSYFEVSDVFGYPLNPTHFGTCEQVLGEALACGVIPVTLSNPAENHIFSNSRINFACGSEEEYIEVIKFLYRDRYLIPEILKIMQPKVLPLYDSNKMVETWNFEIGELIKMKKRKRVWTLPNYRKEMRGFGLYIESLGSCGEIIENGTNKEILELFSTNSQWKSKSKGSPYQYLQAFPNDEHLLKLVSLMKQEG